MMETKEQIFQEFNQGKIDQFYKIIYPQLLLYAVRHLGDNYSFLAEDCVQDAVYQGYLRRHSFTSSVPFLSYLYSCIYNSSISIIRHQVAQDNYLSTRTDWEDVNYINSLIEQEMLEMLYTSIQELPEKYRCLFELSFEQGLKNAEIAEILNITESGVKKRKSQFLEMMRKKMKEKNDKDCMVIFLFLSIGMDIPI